MTGYVRQDTSNEISNGSIIDATELDAEFDALVTAFSTTVGHKHDGSSAEGSPITVVGPAQDIEVTAGGAIPKTDDTYDLGSASFRYKVAYVKTITADSGTVGGSAITTTDNTQTLSNKTINFANNTVKLNGVLLRDALDGSSTGVGVPVFAVSPTLEGTPLAPTAAAGTDTTQIATTEFVDNERSNTATLTNKTINLANNTVRMNSLLLRGSLEGDSTGTGLAVFAVNPVVLTPTINGTINGTAVATTDNAELGSIDTRIMTPLKTKQAITAQVPEVVADTLNANGSAPLFGVRAWVNFTGIGTPVIQAGGNVDSVTSIDNGFYRVTFTTPMEDANYATAVSASYPTLGDSTSGLIRDQTTEYVDIFFGKISDPDSGQDASVVTVQIVR